MDPRNTPPRGPDIGTLKALALFGQLGLTVSLPLVGGALLGQYLDERWGTRGLVFVGLTLLGLASGLYAAWRQIASALK